MGIETCIKCGKSGNVLVCRSSHCAVAIHESCCYPSSLEVHDRENFFCPYCVYKQSAAECSQAREKVLSAERNLAFFLDAKMSVNLEDEPNITMDKRTALQNHKDDDNNQEKGRKDKEIVQFVRTSADLNNGEHDLDRVRTMNLEEGLLRKCGGTINIAMCAKGMTPEENNLCSRWKDKVLAPIPLSYRKQSARVVVMHDEQLEYCNMEKGLELESSGCNLGDRKINGELAKIYEQHETCMSSTNEANSDEISEDSEGYSRLAGQNKIAIEITNYSQGGVSENKDNGCNEPNATISGNAGWIAKPNKKIPDGFRLKKRKRVRWSAEEEEMLKKGVLFFSSGANKNLPWRKILVYGNNVFHQWRTPLDLQSKWKLMTRKEHPKSDEA